MLNPIRLVKDIFDDPHLSNDNLRAFTEDHLIRLTNNNPGAIYSTRITDTSNKLMAFSGAQVSEITKTAVREGLTQVMLVKRRLMLDQIISIGKLVDYKFANDQEKYQQFFPQGVTEYHNADLPSLVPIIERLQTAATTHLNAMHPIDVTALTNSISAFITARTAQLNAFSEEETLATDRRVERKNLTLQLTSNFLILANDHLEQPDAFDNYYEPELLPLTAADDDEEETVFEGTVNMGMPVYIDTGEQTLTETSQLKLQNPGTVAVTYYVANSLNSFPGPGMESFNVIPGGEVVISGADAGVSALRNKLHVITAGPATASYKVIITF